MNDRDRIATKHLTIEQHKAVADLRRRISAEFDITTGGDPPRQLIQCFRPRSRVGR